MQQNRVLGHRTTGSNSLHGAGWLHRSINSGAVEPWKCHLCSM